MISDIHKIPNKVLKNGFSVPVLGFGTWKMGQGVTYGPAQSDQDGIKAIQAAVENGCHAYRHC